MDQQHDQDRDDLNSPDGGNEPFDHSTCNIRAQRRNFSDRKGKGKRKTFNKVCYCKRGSCTDCAGYKAYKQSEKMEARIPEGRRLFHLYPTAPTSPALVDRQIQHIQEAFIAMTRSRHWERQVDGGYYKPEVDFDNVTQLWRVHLHVICYGRDELDQDRITALWRKYLAKHDLWRDPPKPVDCVSIEADDTNHRKIELEYVAKPPQHDLFNAPELLAEYLRLTKGMRLYRPFGACWGANGKAQRERDELTQADKAVERMRDQR